MIQIHSTGRPVAAAVLRAGDEIILDGRVLLITHTLPMPWKSSMRLTMKAFDGSTVRLVLAWDAVVNLAQEESLENPATAMEIYLALAEKGAI